jgi:hypothetical protein
MCKRAVSYHMHFLQHHHLLVIQVVQFMLSQDVKLINSLAHRNMSREFTLFPQLITELRLEVWRLALPKPLSRALYPYEKGCWLLEDLGIDLDLNG